MNKTPKYILDKIQQRAKYQARANKLTLEIDEYLEKNNIEFEYTISHVCLFTEPAMVARVLTSKLTEDEDN